VYKGESFKLFYNLLKKNNLENSLYGFDSFLGLNHNMRGHDVPEKSFNLNALNPLKKYKNVIQGQIGVKLKDFLLKKKGLIKFMHIDTDTYETCLFILKKTKSRMAKNSIILFDEIYNFSGWKEGEYKALTEVYKNNEYNFIAFGKENMRQEAAIMLK